MANKPFDTTIIRPQQQPLSSDVDALQSQLNAAIRDLVGAQYSYENGGVPAYANGFLGYGFKAQSITGVVGVELIPGMGLQYDNTDTPSGIDGVTGLNDVSAYKPIVLSDSRQFTTTDASLGNCRRDRLMVKYNRQLMDYASRYQLSGTPPVFAPIDVYNTLTFDLADPAVASVAYLTASATLPSGYSFVYRKGNEVAYTDEDSFLSAPIPAEDAGYLTLAVMNVGSGITEITPGHIVDYRPLLLPNGCTSLATSLQIMQELSMFANLRSVVPPSCRFVAYKDDGSTTQHINLCLFMGNSDAYGVITGSGRLIPVTSYPTISTYDYLEVRDGGFISTTKAVQEIIDGTTAGYTVLGGFPVAVGAKYLNIQVQCGIIGPQSTGGPGDFGRIASELTVSAGVYNLSVSFNAQRTD